MNETQDEIGGLDPGTPFQAEPERLGDTAAADSATLDQELPPAKVPESAKLTPDKVRKLLKQGTALANEQFGEHVRADLRMTDVEARMIAPGVCWYVNSRPELLAAATGGAEPLIAAAGLALYGVRVLKERTEALRADAMAAEQAQRGVETIEIFEPNETASAEGVPS